MTKEEKDLLLKELCARSPYGIKILYNGIEMEIRGVDVVSKTVDIIDWGKYRFAAVPIENIKPYLRKMSTMTEEEEAIFINKQGYDRYEWLDKNMFDYRGLIPRELALEAPEDMYNVDKPRKEKQDMYGACEHYGTEQCDTCRYFVICYAEFNDIEELEEE